MTEKGDREGFVTNEREKRGVCDGKGDREGFVTEKGDREGFVTNERGWVGSVWAGKGM